MRKLLYIFILFSFSANAQSISNQVISSYGLSASNGMAQTDVTIGEVVTKTISVGSTTLTQGFHQTKLIVTTIKENEESDDYRIYPNPVKETLSISYSGNGPVNVELFDVNGRLLGSKQRIISSEKISFKDRSKGIYLIKVTDNNNKELKTISVIKN